MDSPYGVRLSGRTAIGPSPPSTNAIASRSPIAYTSGEVARETSPRPRRRMHR